MRPRPALPARQTRPGSAVTGGLLDAAAFASALLALASWPAQAQPARALRLKPAPLNLP